MPPRYMTLKDAVHADQLGGAIGSRTHAKLAWSIWVLSLVLAVISLVFVIVDWSAKAMLMPASPPSLAAFGFIILTAFATVGALIASRHSTNPIGWLLCAIGLSFGIGGFTEGYAIHALLVDPGSLPGGAIMAWFSSWIGGPSSLVPLIFLLLLFPTGKLLSRRWRPVAWLAIVALGAHLFLSVVKPGPLQAFEFVNNPFGIDALGSLVARLEVPAFLLLLLPSLLASAISLILRFRRAQGEERQQLKWLASAGALLAAMFVIGPIFWFNPALPGLVWQVPTYLAFTAIPISVGIAILKYHLYDIDLIINRTLVYGALMVSVVSIYVLVVAYLGVLFRASGNLFISLVATGLVAVIFQPLRDYLQRSVNRLLYGERDEPYAVISRLGQRLETTLAPDAVLPTIVQTVRDALKVPYVAIALTRDDPGMIVAAGAAVDDALRLPLVYQSEVVGELHLAPRGPGEGFSPADRRLLDDLTRQAGIAVHAVRLHTHALQLAADLQGSRERLVTAREEERRRLRRDLHDGLGPALAGLTLKIDAAHDELESDVDAAAALLRDLKTDVQAAIADIRRLVYALRPPALDELGLVAALRMQISHYRQPGLQITVEAPTRLPPLPAAVEAAAYRIIMEALTNVVRHAQAQTCHIRLTLTDVLELEVVDDGRGLPLDHHAGVGLLGMRERAAELGGTCTITALPSGGTRMYAQLPLPSGCADTDCAAGDMGG
jgi:two-component system NarL family sensor kinase